ncbi:pyridoxine kinase [Alkalibacterium putridalgicola]|uniref:pyridoxal kinase n=1 Tax=Alkalibacterium putridalgicola TaxID=426703 RepID=A0A1H7URK9_9LACT|nr:bifunctional hydroxymethylpyrimidine kinase/phosphomethylpyrimidine kinase [Alkalibacterium putridalgicola]GEK88504.1 hydroxymethylpyrimidine/phosphomethylpyrimidine kinase [Alkalibacterium putridalgicola]SEL99601.1 pyridoxine kinase [Alkalibacterium putridalgicola]
MTKPNLTLTIAGNDASGGAGIAADLKTFAEYGTYGIAALTTIATMDPENNWSHGVTAINAHVVKDQLVTAFAGPKIGAAKTGMLPDADVVNVIADKMEQHRDTPLVVDPVMVCKGEDEVLNPQNVEAIKNRLIPLATVTTPNLFEAGQLAELGLLFNLEDMKKAAKIIHEKGAKIVVVKGGKALAGNEAIDLVYDGNEYITLTSPKVENANNHGAGCTFAAAITAGIAQGLDPIEAIRKAKTFVTEAIEAGFEYNEFVGPVFHSGYRLNRQDSI